MLIQAGAGCVVEAWGGAECNGLALGVGKSEASDDCSSDFPGAFVGAGFDGFGKGRRVDDGGCCAVIEAKK